MVLGDNFGSFLFGATIAGNKPVQCAVQYSAVLCDVLCRDVE